MLLIQKSLLGAICLIGVYGLPSGPPVSGNEVLICTQLSPSPAAHGSPASSGNGGYVITTTPPLTLMPGSPPLYEYVPDQTYTGEFTSKQLAS